MIEESDINSIIIVLISGLISIVVALIAYFGQKKTLKGQVLMQRELENLKDELTRGRFYTEKWWNEAISLYADFARISRSLAVRMATMKNLPSGDPLYLLSLLYIRDKLFGFHRMRDWNRLLQDASEEEAREINYVKRIYQPEHLRQLRLDLENLIGYIHIFASQEIFDYYASLVELGESFLSKMKNLIESMIAESPKKTNSRAETKVSTDIGNIPTTSKKESNELKDIELIFKKYSGIVALIHEQIRNEIGAGRLKNLGSETQYAKNTKQNSLRLEYQEIGSNLRMYGTLRRNEVTILLIFTGALLAATAQFKNLAVYFSTFGIVIALFFLFMMKRLTEYYFISKKRAIEIERLLGIEQFQFLEEELKRTKLNRFTSTKVTYLTCVIIILLWICISLMRL